MNFTFAVLASLRNAHAVLANRSVLTRGILAILLVASASVTVATDCYNTSGDCSTHSMACPSGSSDQFCSNSGCAINIQGQQACTASMTAGVTYAGCASSATSCNTTSGTCGAAGVKATGNITYSVTSGCGTSRHLIICEAWVECSSGNIACSQCSTFTYDVTLGGTQNLPSYTCTNVTSGSSYQYTLKAYDKTGTTNDCNVFGSCPGACGCTGNCNQDAIAGSCCVKD